MTDASDLFSPPALAHVRGEDPSARGAFERERDELLHALAARMLDTTPEHRGLPYALTEGRAIFYVERLLDEVRRAAGEESYSGFSFAIDARHGALGFHSFLWFLLDEPLLDHLGAPVGSEVMTGVLAPERPRVATFHQEGCVFLHVDAIPLDAPSFSRAGLESAVTQLPHLFDLADTRLAERFLRWHDARGRAR